MPQPAMATSSALNNWKGWRWLLPVSVVGMVLAVILWKPSRGSQKLAGGGKVTLVKVTAGKTDRMTMDTRLRDRLGLFLPESLALKWGCRIRVERASQERCLVWTTWTGNENLADHVITLMDEKGTVLGSSLNARSPAYSRDAPWTELAAFGLPPSTARKIEVRIYRKRLRADAKGSIALEELARFIVRNPAYAKSSSGF